MFTVERSLSLFHYFHSYALANEVLNLFRVDIMPHNKEENSLWLLETSFPFLFRTTALALSRPIRRVTSSSVAWLLEEIYGSIVDELADFAIHLRWYLTAYH
jgi:hypothetical protein